MEFIKKYKINCEVIKKGYFNQQVILNKEIKVYKKTKNNIIVTLIIPVGTIINIPTTYCEYSQHKRKCRAQYAVVADIRKGYKKLNIAKSNYEYYVYYKDCEFVFPNRFSYSLATCDSGIHFFFSRKDAIRYNFT